MTNMTIDELITFLRREPEKKAVSGKWIKKRKEWMVHPMTKQMLDQPVSYQNILKLRKCAGIGPLMTDALLEVYVPILEYIVYEEKHNGAK